MKKIQLKQHQILENINGLGKIISLSDCSILKNNIEIIQIKNTLHQFETDIIDDRYLWLCSHHGESNIHVDEVINKKDLLTEQNPKQKYQVEPNGQFFSIYDFEHSDLGCGFYCYPHMKKYIFTEYLTKKLSKDIKIKNIYIGIDEFAEIIQKINNVKFSATSDLLNRDHALHEAVTDIWGYEAPYEFTIESKYNTKDKRPLIDRIKQLRAFIDTGEIKGLKCIGTDDNNVEFIYNVDSLTKGYELEVLVDEDSGLLNKIDVKEKILKKIS